MKKFDARPIISAIKRTVDSHKLEEPGAYCRWLWQNEKGKRVLGKNEYGCADAMNILYTIGEFQCDDKTRNDRIEALRSMQNADGGLFVEATHHPIHTTAHCAAALELFDVRPKYALTALRKYTSKDGLYSLLEGLNWNDPWPESHKGAGIYAALVNAGEITEEFSENYFKWLYDNADEETGFWKSGIADKAPRTSLRYPNGKDMPDAIYSYMAGGFHYIFNHEYAKMPLRYPEKIIDTCIQMYENGYLPSSFGKNINFIEVDWVYSINRASRQTAYKREKVVELIYDFAEKYIKYLILLYSSTQWMLLFHRKT